MREGEVKCIVSKCWGGAVCVKKRLTTSPAYQYRIGYVNIFNNDTVFVICKDIRKNKPNSGGGGGANQFLGGI